MGSGIEQVPAQQGGSVKTAILDMFNVLFDPVPVFNRIKQKPSILYPWLVISAIVLVITIVTGPYNDAAMAAMRASMPPEQAARMGGGGGVGRLIGVPIFTLIFAAAGAGLLWIGVSLSATQARYKTLLSVLLHANMTYVLFALVTALVLMVRGVGAITGLADMRPPLGLDLLVPNASLYLGQVLNGINPFSIWGVWLCGTGIAITHGVSKSTAIIVTSIVYVLALLLMSAPLLLVKVPA